MTVGNRTSADFNSGGVGLILPRQRMPAGSSVSRPVTLRFLCGDCPLQMQDLLSQVIDPPGHFVDGLFHPAGNQRDNAQEQKHLANRGDQPAGRSIIRFDAKVTGQHHDGSQRQQRNSAISAQLTGRSGPIPCPDRRILHGQADHFIRGRPRCGSRLGRIGQPWPTCFSTPWRHFRPVVIGRPAMGRFWPIGRFDGGRSCVGLFRRDDDRSRDSNRRFVLCGGFCCGFRRRHQVQRSRRHQGRIQKMLCRPASQQFPGISLGVLRPRSGHSIQRAHSGSQFGMAPRAKHASIVCRQFSGNIGPARCAPHA